MNVRRIRGFTLVELVMVIMITGVIAASLTIFLKPAIDSYVDARRRADLSDMADTALRRMGQDIRRAVPNSVSSISNTCFKLAPTITGGRYRMASDTLNDTVPMPCTPSTCSAPLDISVAVTVLDVLSPMATVPAQNDWLVINNQNGADVYTGTNRAQISATPAEPARPGDGLHRINIGSTQFPVGYDGGRFVVVSNTEQTVFYSCVNNTLYRTVTAFGADDSSSCALTTGAAAVVATADIVNCQFIYDPNQGATQQSGFVWMRLELGRNGENIALAHGAHVDNVP